MTYLLLFYEFFKTGLFAVGGGLATLPFLYDMAARAPRVVHNVTTGGHGGRFRVDPRPGSV